MLKFGLACEGITDHAVIENILCGFYQEQITRDDIKAFQPLFDETQRKQLEGGGWKMLLKHLSSKRFRQGVRRSKFMIIQIDTDISEDEKFNVLKGNLSIEEFIEKVIERLINQIDSKKKFYQENKKKIIFAISVHSLECWILPLYLDSEQEIIDKCEDSLKRAIETLPRKPRSKKNYKNYQKLTQNFVEYEKLIKIASQNSSFQIFINKLPKEI